MSSPDLDPDQLRAANPSASVWVSANAGAGKTQVLANRIARLLLAGAEPASILCLTYTKAGAAEMAARIHRTLGDWTGFDDRKLARLLKGIGIPDADAGDLRRARQLFALALDTPGGFKIQTIHGFCERILQLFPVEAGMSPGFTVLDDARKTQLLDQVRDEVLEAARAEPDGELARALATIGQYAAPDSLAGLIDEMRSCAMLSGAPGNNGFTGLIDEQLRRCFGLDAETSCEALAEEIAAADDGMLRQLGEDLVAGGGTRNGELGQALLKIAAETDAALRFAAVRETLVATKGMGLREPLKVSKTKPPELQQRLQQLLSAECARVKPLVIRHDELKRIEATCALAIVAAEIERRFRAIKASRAAYDFDDLIERTRALLADASASAWVLYKLDKQIEHVLVDEAQDTSPPQWQIMKTLTEEFFAGLGEERRRVRTLFVVGDQKQSIFSFQGADLRSFAETQDYFSRRSAAAKLALSIVPLTVSYRSQRAVLAAVDCVFATGSAARQSLGIAGSEGLLHQFFRPGPNGIVELWPLETAEDDAEFDKWQAPRQVREHASPQLRLARKIAAVIAGWIGKRWLPDEQRMVRPDDVLLLFRGRNNMFDLMIAALREAGVPVAGADRLRPEENLAVQDMLALMRVSALPEDDYALACLLKSPLVSQPLDEDQLFRLCHDRGSDSVWQRLAASEEPAARACHDELLHWRELARELRPYEFVAAVLRARKRHIVARLGGEAADALRALGEQALAYEREHGASLSGFAEWFRSEAAEIKRDMDKGQGEVRLMTVHGAKGLEATIVMLPDAAHYGEKDRDRLLFVSAGGESGDVPLWKLSGKATASETLDRIKAGVQAHVHSEFTRLLYVAMTRARNELYICGASDKARLAPESWYAMAEAALKAADGARAVEDELAGLVWRLGDEPAWPEPRSEERQDQDQPLALPSCLRMPVADPGRSPAAITPSLLAHPGGKTFDAAAARAGVVCHRILERLPGIAPEGRAAYVARHMARNRLDPGFGEQLLKVLAMPEIAALFGEGSSAETAIGLMTGDGRPFSGVMDRLVIREQDILVLDYKSDALVPARTGPSHPHFRQMASYCFALQKLHPGKQVRASILWLGRLRLEWLDPAELADAVAALAGQTGSPQP